VQRLQEERCAGDKMGGKGRMTMPSIITSKISKIYLPEWWKIWTRDSPMWGGERGGLEILQVRGVGSLKGAEGRGGGGTYPCVAKAGNAFEFGWLHLAALRTRGRGEGAQNRRFGQDWWTADARELCRSSSRKWGF